MGMFSSDPRPVVDCSQDEGRTKQAFKDECDVNQIMARYEKTGLITHLAKKQPVYLDVSEVGDYRDALEHVEQTREFFMGFPAKVRAAFNNDPAEFLDSIHDPAKQDFLRELGLISPEAKAEGGGAATTPVAPTPQRSETPEDAAGGSSDA